MTKQDKAIQTKVAASIYLNREFTQPMNRESLRYGTRRIAARVSLADGRDADAMKTNVERRASLTARQHRFLLAFGAMRAVDVAEVL